MKAEKGLHIVFFSFIRDIFVPSVARMKRKERPMAKEILTSTWHSSHTKIHFGLGRDMRWRWSNRRHTKQNCGSISHRLSLYQTTIRKYEETRYCYSTRINTHKDYSWRTSKRLAEIEDTYKFVTIPIDLYRLQSSLRK